MVHQGQHWRVNGWEHDVQMSHAKEDTQKRGIDGENDKQSIYYVFLYTISEFASASWQLGLFIPVGICVPFLAQTDAGKVCHSKLVFIYRSQGKQHTQSTRHQRVPLSEESVWKVYIKIFVIKLCRLGFWSHKSNESNYSNYFKNYRIDYFSPLF
jgi:hypothetical protein